MTLSQLVSVIYEYESAKCTFTYQKKDIELTLSLMNEMKKTFLLNIKNLTSLEFDYLTKKK